MSDEDWEVEAWRARGATVATAIEMWDSSWMAALSSLAAWIYAWAVITSASGDPGITFAGIVVSGGFALLCRYRQREKESRFAQLSAQAAFRRVLLTRSHGGVYAWREESSA